jgi:cholest-4-en-3-one 26-monooxygenase
MELNDIDLLSRDVFAERMPHEWFAHLRVHAPIYRHPEPNGPGFWVVSRHKDVVAMNRNWEAFSSSDAQGGVIGLEDDAERDAAAAAQNGAGRMMLTMDPPDHTRYRKLVSGGFTPRMIRALEDRLREASIRIIDRAMGKDGGRSDFVVDLAAELPLEAIAEFLGVPYEDRHRLFEWSNKMVGSEDPEYAVSPEAVADAGFQMFMYANALGANRRANPREDIVSRLVHAVVDGDQLSEMDFDMFFLLLSVAGNETTRNALSQGMAALLEHPDQYQLMVDDPSIIGATAVDEVLRFGSPVMYFRRNVSRDVEYGGHHFAKGDKVTLWYASANRDEAVFERPDEFDVLRNPNPHVTFGGGGPHNCVGMHLARLEMKVLFEELVARVPHIEKLGEPERLRSNFINGIKHLPVRLLTSREPAGIA